MLICDVQGVLQQEGMDWYTDPQVRALLEGEGVRSGEFQSGCRAVTGDVKRLGGGYWRLEMRLGAGVGVWGCLWGVVRAGVLGGRGVPPPPLFKRFPAAGPLAAPQAALRAVRHARAGHREVLRDARLQRRVPRPAPPAPRGRGGAPPLPGADAARPQAAGAVDAGAPTAAGPRAAAPGRGTRRGRRAPATPRLQCVGQPDYPHAAGSRPAVPDTAADKGPVLRRGTGSGGQTGAEQQCERRRPDPPTRESSAAAPLGCADAHVAAAGSFPLADAHALSSPPLNISAPLARASDLRPRSAGPPKALLVTDLRSPPQSGGPPPFSAASGVNFQLSVFLTSLSQNE